MFCFIWLFKNINRRCFMWSDCSALSKAPSLASISSDFFGVTAWSSSYQRKALKCSFQFMPLYDALLWYHYVLQPLPCSTLRAQETLFPTLLWGDRVLLLDLDCLSYKMKIMGKGCFRFLAMQEVMMFGWPWPHYRLVRAIGNCPPTNGLQEWG